MANTPDYFIKNMIGELAGQVAILQSQLEAANDTIATLRAAAAPPVEDAAPVEAPRKPNGRAALG